MNSTTVVSSNKNRSAIAGTTSQQSHPPHLETPLCGCAYHWCINQGLAPQSAYCEVCSMQNALCKSTGCCGQAPPPHCVQICFKPTTLHSDGGMVASLLRDKFKRPKFLCLIDKVNLPLAVRASTGKQWIAGIRNFYSIIPSIPPRFFPVAVTEPEFPGRKLP